MASRVVSHQVKYFVLTKTHQLIAYVLVLQVRIEVAACLGRHFSFSLFCVKTEKWMDRMVLRQITWIDELWTNEKKLFCFVCAAEIKIPESKVKMLILCHLNKKSCCLKEHSLCQISFGLFTFRSDRLILEKVFYFLEGWRHSSVDSSLPTILRSRVWIPSTPYTLLCNQILCYICHCSEKMRIISKKRPGFVYSLKSFFNPMP